MPIVPGKILHIFIHPFQVEHRFLHSFSVLMKKIVESMGRNQWVQIEFMCSCIVIIIELVGGLNV